MSVSVRSVGVGRREGLLLLNICEPDNLDQGISEFKTMYQLKEEKYRNCIERVVSKERDWSVFTNCFKRV